MRFYIFATAVTITTTSIQALRTSPYHLTPSKPDIPTNPVTQLSLLRDWICARKEKEHSLVASEKKIKGSLCVCVRARVRMRVRVSVSVSVRMRMRVRVRVRVRVRKRVRVSVSEYVRA